MNVKQHVCEVDGSNCRQENVCTNTYAKILTDCDDGDPSTVQDVCYANGECRGKPMECRVDTDCDDSNQCTGDKCYDGICEHKNLEDTLCDDNDPNTEFSMCLGDKCTSVPRECSVPQDCSDNNACTADLCEHNWLCKYDASAMVGKECTDPSSQYGLTGKCDNSGDCLFDARYTCYSDNECDSKLPVSVADCFDAKCLGVDKTNNIRGMCEFTPAINGKVCRTGEIGPDGNAVDGLCTDGKCIPSNQPNKCDMASNCDDANPCTEDLCQKGFCQYQNLTGTACPNGICENGRCVPSDNSCINGSYRCFNNQSQVCSYNSWVTRYDCGALETTCLADTGKCEWISCPEGVTECWNGNVEQCQRINGKLTWVISEQCGTGKTCENATCVAAGAPSIEAQCNADTTDNWKKGWRQCYNNTLIGCAAGSYVWECRNNFSGVGTCLEIGGDLACAGFNPHPEKCPQVGQHYCAVNRNFDDVGFAYRCVGDGVEWNTYSFSSQDCHRGKLFYK